jgi:hypothetical protein
MPSTSSFEQVRNRFNGIRWHDSELRSIFVSYSVGAPEFEDACEIVLRVNVSLRKSLSEPETFAPSEIRFAQARFLHTDLDLLGLAYCGGDISDAECQRDSKFIQQFISEKARSFTLPQDAQSLEELKHFGVYLCNPSGEINIVAKDFEIVTLAIG